MPFLKVFGGTGVAPPAGTQEIWFMATDYNSNSAGNYRTRSQGGSGNFRYTFSVPLDFSALVSLELIGIPNAGAAGPAKNIDLFSDYGLIGQASNINSESDTTSTYDLTGTSGQITAVTDLSTVFSLLVAGHFCGVLNDHLAIGGTIEYLGIRLRYTPA